MVLACWQINLRLAEIWHLNKKYGVNNQSLKVCMTLILFLVKCY